MRIRKRLPLSSEAAAPPSDQPSKHPSDQSMPLHTKDHQQKEFGDETLRSIETNNDICRKIVTSLYPPLSSSQELECKVVPLKKRKGRSDGCSRVNGRGWRCGQPTLVGYSLCQHHLGKGRRGGGGGGDSDEEAKVVVEKKRKKVGVVKARSMSSLLSQI